MKKRLLSAMGAGLLLVACSTTPKFVVNGTVAGLDSTAVNAYVISVNDEGAQDTLSQTVVKDGKFTLEGNVPSITSAYIVLEGQRGGLPIYLENKEFTATIDLTDANNTTITGSEAQDLANQFKAIDQEAAKLNQELYAAYQEAAKAEDKDKMAEIQKQYQEQMPTFNDKKMALIDQNGNSIVSANIISQECSRWSLEDLKARYNNLTPEIQSLPVCQKIAARIAKLEAVEIGQVAPDFVLANVAGDSVDMHQVEGKLKIVDFWASWCGPCRGENPNVLKVYNKYHDKGLEIISVSLDNDRDAWTKAIDDDKLPWIHVSDLQGWKSSAAQLYAVTGIPCIYLLDGENKIIAKNLRGEALEEKIAEILK